MEFMEIIINIKASRITNITVYTTKSLHIHKYAMFTCFIKWENLLTH